jgi:hypothetical protein
VRASTAPDAPVTPTVMTLPNETPYRKSKSLQKCAGMTISV